MDPLRISTSKAFAKDPGDLLALALDALGRIWTREGRPLWQQALPITPYQPPSGGSYFIAIAAYSYRADDHMGGVSVSQQSVRLTCHAHAYDLDGRRYFHYTLDFTDSGYGRTEMETIVAATCYQIFCGLLERQWTSDQSAPGFWRLVNRSWTHPIIANALGPNATDIAGFMIMLQRYGLFPSIDRESLDHGLWARRLFNR